MFQNLFEIKLYLMQVPIQSSLNSFLCGFVLFWKKQSTNYSSTPFRMFDFGEILSID